MTNDPMYFKTTIAKLTVQLKDIGDTISKIVAKVNTATTKTNFGELKDQLAFEYEKARNIIGQWTNAEIPAIYKDAVKQEIASIKNQIESIPHVNATDLESNSKNLQDVLDNVLTSFDSGLSNGEQTLNRLVNLTQQTLLDEQRVNQDIAQGYTEKGSAQASRKALQNDLMSKAQDDKYIEVIDKNGDVRNYEIRDYAELVARTKLSDASFQAVLDTADQVGNDLVQISSHNTLTPLCAEYEGKIFSLSGNDPDFPLLDLYPPFHPNCLHSASIVYKEALQADGTLDKYINFSNGDSEKPPTFPGFIPVDQREMNA